MREAIQARREPCARGVGGCTAAALTYLPGGAPDRRMFAVLRQLVSLQEDDSGDEPAAADHYLYFRGIPNPPDDYSAPIGASPNT